jgi:hypothetical protein
LPAGIVTVSLVDITQYTEDVKADPFQYSHDPPNC